MEDHCTVPFSKFAEFLDALAGVRKHTQKTQVLHEFFELSHVQNFFPLVRLMLPAFDMERSQYGLKESTLAKLYAELLSLPDREKEALKYYKNPQKALPGCPAGSFSEVLQFVLRNRVGDNSCLSIADVNRELDELANSLSKDDKKRVLAGLLQRTNAAEQKWLTKIVLKDLKLGSNEKILKCFHPRALELFYNTNSLRQVFTRLKDKGTDLGLQLFQLHTPIRPMLAGRKVYDELKKLLISLEVYVETKFDGERIQCHLSADGQVSFFTRNANNYTYLYGPKMRDYMLQAVTGGIQSIILDGEMIVWDTTLGKPAPFGQNKPVALSDTEGSQHLTYMAFDVLYLQTLDGEELDLMKRPLSERKQTLDSCLTRIPLRVEKVLGKRVVGTKAVLDEFHRAIERDEEGVIAKQVTSPYLPDDRSTLWLKLKTDYIEGIGDSLDLLIIGGYYGSERRTSIGDDIDHITVFLMAIASSVDIKDPRRSKFVPFCKVGTGYSLDDLRQLREKLRSCMRPYNNTPPDYWPSWTPAVSERPDYVVADPSKSVLLECRGAELVRTEKFAAGICLRFPKVSRLRLDKSWDLCMTVAEVQNLTQSLIRGEKPAPAAEVPQQSSSSEKRKYTGKRVGEVAPFFKDTDTSDIQPVSQIFAGHEFLFLTLREYSKSKEELERLVVQYGGSKVQNYLPSTTDVIASDASVLRVQNFIQTFDLDIKKPEWIQACVDTQKVVETGPRYLLHTSSQTSEYFRTHFSPYGDAYFVDYYNAKDLMDVAMSVPKETVTEQKAKINDNWAQSLPDEFQRSCGVGLQKCVSVHSEQALLIA